MMSMQTDTISRRGSASRIKNIPAINFDKLLPELKISVSSIRAAVRSKIPSVFTTAYLFRVLSGKEKKVIGLFAREGIELTQLPIDGYLLCYDPKCKEIRFLETIENYIVNFAEIDKDEANRLKNEGLVPVTEADIQLQVGKIVTVVEGEYKGQSGLVREINNGKIHIDVCFFGRMRRVDLETYQIARSIIPEGLR